MLLLAKQKGTGLYHPQILDGGVTDVTQAILRPASWFGG
jgi:hypothetical protein